MSLTWLFVWQTAQSWSTRRSARSCAGCRRRRACAGRSSWRCRARAWWWWPTLRDTSPPSHSTAAGSGTRRITITSRLVYFSYLDYVFCGPSLTSLPWRRYYHLKTQECFFSLLPNTKPDCYRRLPQLIFVDQSKLNITVFMDVL